MEWAAWAWPPHPLRLLSTMPEGACWGWAWAWPEGHRTGLGTAVQWAARSQSGPGRWRGSSQSTCGPSRATWWAGWTGSRRGTGGTTALGEAASERHRAPPTDRAHTAMGPPRSTCTDLTSHPEALSPPPLYSSTHISKRVGAFLAPCCMKFKFRQVERVVHLLESSPKARSTAIRQRQISALCRLAAGSWHPLGPQHGASLAASQRSGISTRWSSRRSIPSGSASAQQPWPSDGRRRCAIVAGCSRSEPLWWPRAR